MSLPLPENPSDPNAPAIFVVALANNPCEQGRGAWLPADQGAMALELGTLAVPGGAPEAEIAAWVIHGSENFAGLTIGEHESLVSVARLGIGVRTYGRPFAHFARWVGHSRATYENFETSYVGCFADAISWVDERHHQADQRLDNIRQQLPTALRPYLQLDLNSYMHDLQAQGEVHVAVDIDGHHIFERVQLEESSQPEGVVHSTSTQNEPGAS